MGSNNYTLLNVPFSSNLIDYALTQVSDRCIFVFPSRISAEKAREKFLPNWKFEACEFISIEDFKDWLILPSEPPLTDEKRLLCLYQALTLEDKKFFKFYTYFDLISWGNNFFQFFEELNDEDILPEEIENRIDLREWQQDFLAKILNIRENYQKLLEQKGFTDPIFYRKASQLKIPFSGYKVIWVNQFYYSKLELAILKALAESENEVVVISQTENADFNPQNRKNTSLNLENLAKDDYLTQKIKVIETENEDQMVISFLGKLGKNQNIEGTTAIIDSHYWDKHYRNLMNPALFDFSNSINLINSSPYQFLNILKEHLQALTTLSFEGKEITALPIKLMLDAVGNESFVHYYFPKDTIQSKEELLNELTTLRKKDVYWLDKNMNCLQVFHTSPHFNKLTSLVENHFSLLEEIAKINSPADLINLIDTEEMSIGLNIKRMCSENEILHSDLLEQFYQRIANFASTDNLQLVQDWNSFFASSGKDLALNVFQLFLDYLENAGYKFFYEIDKENNPITITNTMDSRNLRYDNLVIFHAIEGEFPSAPKPVWLLNEAQKGQLGLKTYNDLREWERYYFFRLILTSRNVLIYTYRNSELDIEPGSFVTELQHLNENHKLNELEFDWVSSEVPLSKYYDARQQKYSSGENNLLASYPDYLLNREENPQIDEKDFFILPCEPTKDFGENLELTCSYYNLQQLLDNTFVWYIQWIQQLQEIDFRPKDTVSAKIVGSLVHRFISDLLSPFNGKPCKIEELQELFYQPVTTLAEYFTNLFTSKDFFFQLPQNYSLKFLKDIYTNYLPLSMQSFYEDFLSTNLADKVFTLFAESGIYDDNLTQEHLLPLPPDNQESEIKVILRGRSDLRIETDDKKFIVDFKTGRNPDKGQLLFYEWLYYRWQQEDMDISPIFWIINDNKIIEKTKYDDANKWRNTIYETLHKCRAEGYKLPKTVTQLKQLKRITRADLYRPKQGGNNE